MKPTNISIESNTLFVYRATVPKVKRSGQAPTDPTTTTITFTTTTHRFNK